MNILATIPNIMGECICRVYTSFAKAQKRPIVKHCHTEFEISLILKGCGTYNTDSGDLPFVKGDIFIFSTNEYHHISEIREDMTVLNIQFLPTFIYDASLINKEFSYMNVFLNRSENFCNMLTRENEHTEEIRKLFYRIMDECQSKPECLIEQVHSLIVSILITIYRYYGYADTSNGKRTYSEYSVNLQQALTFMNAHYCEEIKLDDIIASAKLTKTHFTRVFKSFYNMTAWDYINIKRIDKALALLADTNETVLSIATRCGYNNTANFNRIFKKITGTTPKAYRTAHS